MVRPNELIENEHRLRDGGEKEDHQPQNGVRVVARLHENLEVATVVLVYVHKGEDDANHAAAHACDLAVDVHFVKSSVRQERAQRKEHCEGKDLKDGVGPNQGVVSRGGGGRERRFSHEVFRSAENHPQLHRFVSFRFVSLCLMPVAPS